MEGANPAFFSAARRYGINNTIISLVDHAELDWAGRFEYLRAVASKRQVDLYAMDLICLMARGMSAKWGGTFQGELPSAIEYGTHKQDTRTAAEIKAHILKRVKEG